MPRNPRAGSTGTALPGDIASRGELCREIRAYLERRATGLSDAVRRYPTPIARCDEQLPALIASRREVLQLLEADDATLVAAFVAAAARWDDAAAAALAARAQRLAERG